MVHQLPLRGGARHGVPNALWEDARPAFAQERTWRRARTLALSALVEFNYRDRRGGVRLPAVGGYGNRTRMDRTAVAEVAQDGVWRAGLLASVDRNAAIPALEKGDSQSAGPGLRYGGRAFFSPIALPGEGKQDGSAPSMPVYLIKRGL